MTREKVIAVHPICGVDVYEADESYPMGKARLTRRVFRFVHGAYPGTAYTCYDLQSAQDTLARLTA